MHFTLYTLYTIQYSSVHYTIYTVHAYCVPPVADCCRHILPLLLILGYAFSSNGSVLFWPVGPTQRPVVVCYQHHRQRFCLRTGRPPSSLLLSCRRFRLPIRFVFVGLENAPIHLEGATILVAGTTGLTPRPRSTRSRGCCLPEGVCVRVIDLRRLPEMPSPFWFVHASPALPACDTSPRRVGGARLKSDARVCASECRRRRL